MKDRALRPWVSVIAGGASLVSHAGGVAGEDRLAQRAGRPALAPAATVAETAGCPRSGQDRDGPSDRGRWRHRHHAGGDRDRLGAGQGLGTGLEEGRRFHPLPLLSITAPAARGSRWPRCCGPRRRARTPPPTTSPPWTPRRPSCPPRGATAAPPTRRCRARDAARTRDGTLAWKGQPRTQSALPGHQPEPDLDRITPHWPRNCWPGAPASPARPRRGPTSRNRFDCKSPRPGDQKPAHRHNG